MPYYLYLATRGAFFENHCSQLGTNSTPNHLVLVGGQSPTLRNPPRGTTPEWDLRSIFGLAEAGGVGRRAYTDASGCPVSFYTQLKGSPNIVSTDRFVADAENGPLPPLVFVWHATPQDEHPPAT